MITLDVVGLSNAGASAMSCMQAVEIRSQPPARNVLLAVNRCNQPASTPTIASKIMAKVAADINGPESKRTLRS